MMVEQMFLLDKMANDYSALDDDLIDFTHMLNRIAIQHIFMQDEDSDEDAPVLTQMNACNNIEIREV